MRRSPVVHPFMFALYPVLSVLAASLPLLNPSQAIRPMIIFLLITSVILIIIHLLCKDWYRAGFLTSIIVWMLFFYGYSYRLPQYIQVFGLLISRHIIILCFWGVFISCLSTNWLWRRVRPQVITNFLNLSSGLALLYAIYLIGSFFYGARRDPLSNWSRPLNPSENGIQLSGNYRPDIYYIILDGYARSDILGEIYQYDNSEFIDSLKIRGFFIANQSHSNYDGTQLSLASSMNFEFLDYLSYAGGVSINRSPLANLIINSRVRALLEDDGYKIYLSGEYLFAEINDPAVIFFSAKRHLLNTFESLLLESTVFEILVDEAHINISTYTYQTHREKILDAFAEVNYLTTKEGPKFVFVHIIAPHPPFVFDKNGNPIQPDWVYTISDATQFSGGQEAYIEGYRQQVMYINTQVIKMIDQILQDSSDPPIIILQADHGPAALRSSSPNTICIKERLSILNAYYLPNGENGDLYPTITPVNTFRIIFNSYFETHFKLLPDKIYISSEGLYRFDNVTQQADIPCGLNNPR